MPTAVESELLNILKYSGLEKKNLQELVKIVSGLAEKGNKFQRVFPIGIPAPDGVKVQGVSTTEGLNSIIGMLKDTPRLSSVIIFPYGIPQIDGFGFEITVQSSAGAVR